MNFLSRSGWSILRITTTVEKDRVADFDITIRNLTPSRRPLARIIQKSATSEWINHTLTINDRQRLVINALLDGADRELSTSRYAKLASCSLDTALRDIKLLLDAGVLAPGPSGGRSTKYKLQSPPPHKTT